MSAAREHSSPIARMLVRHARRLNIRLYPELARLDTEQERDRALGAVGVIYGRWWWYSASIVVTLGGGLVVGVVAAEGLQRVGIPSVVGSAMVRAVAVFGGLAVGGIALGCLYRARNRRELRRVLVARGVAICVACGYDLTGNVSGRCPECGTLMVAEGRPVTSTEGEEQRPSAPPSRSSKRR